MKKEIEIKTLGDYLKYKMFEREKSTRDVAKELGMTNSTLWRIASGLDFRIKWIIPVAEWCELNPEQLWDLLKIKL